MNAVIIWTCAAQDDLDRINEGVEFESDESIGDVATYNAILGVTPTWDKKFVARHQSLAQESALGPADEVGDDYTGFTWLLMEGESNDTRQTWFFGNPNTGDVALALVARKVGLTT